MNKRSWTGGLVLAALAALAVTGCPGTNEPGQSGEKQILSFAVAVGVEFKAGVIDETNHAITLTLPAGTDVRALTPVITVSAKATVSPASGTSRDFTAAVTYTVTAEDGSVQEYTVTVTVSPDSQAADRTALNTAITTANAAKAGIAVDTAAGNVLTGSQWVTWAAMDALNTAITAANTVVQDTAATQEQVDAAVTALNTATTTFNAAKQAGTKPAADKTALNTAITTANAAKNGIAVNTAAENVQAGTRWVTQGVMDTFDAAIAAAETVSQSAAATQAEVDAATPTLEAAVAAFNAAKQEGTKPGPADRTDLNTAIATANAAKNGIVVNTDAANVLVGSKWVIQAAMDAFNAAIAAANTVSQNAGATQAEVNLAEAALNEAITVFNDAKQDGTKPGPAEDKTALNTAIATATDARTGIVVDTAAMNVTVGTRWVTQAVMNTFEAAIAEAEAVAQDAEANQAEVDEAADTLNDAIATFNSAKQEGAKSEAAADKAALNTAISTANAAKTGIVVDTDSGNVLTGIYWVTQGVMDTFNAAIAAAETVSQNTEATQTAVDTEVNALNEAITAFNAAKQAGSNASGTLLAVITIVVPSFTDGGAGIAGEQQTITLYRNGTTNQATASLTGTTADITAIEWRTGGAVKGTGTSLTIHAGDYNAGTHYFTVEVMRNGAPWSTEFTLIVINNQSAD